MNTNLRVLLLSALFHRVAFTVRVAGCACLFALFGAVSFSHAASFTVTTTADTGAGSLRQAITDANADATTPRVINFNIGGGGGQTLTLASALPEITGTVTLDGTTQPGYVAGGAPLIVIDGGGTVDANGLTVNYSASGSAGPVFKALCLVRFGVNGGAARHGIELVAGDAMTVTGCYIGIGADGTTPMRNTGDGIVHRTPFATPGVYGGSTAADRNVISGNLGAGIRVENSFATVIGNYIGTSANGLTAVPNGEGVLVTTNASTQVKIGTATAGQGNVISGNTGSGVHLMKSSSVLGNVVGLAVDGTALGNGQHGVFLDNTSGTIGATTAGAGNTISSNGGDGVRATGGGASVLGNRIGADSAGTIARGNTGHGVNVVAGTGDVSVSSNVISANGSGGVQIVTTGKAGAANNFIGVNADATAKLGNNGNGITILNGLPNAATQNDFSNNTIGGNTGAGIEFTSANVHEFHVRRNNIGTDSAGTANLGNTGPGIRITGGAQDQTIGGPFFTNTDDANRIAFNGGDGVEMDSRNFVTINLIHDNGGLAVDLLPNGVNPPTGGGELNTPVISDVTTTATDVTFTFTHDAKASTGYRGLFYRNDTADPSGHGEMQTYLGTMTWTSNGSGHFAGAATFPLPSGAAAAALAVAQGEPSYTVLVCTNEVSLVVNKSGELALNFGGNIVPIPTKSVTNGSVGQSANTNEPINTFSGELFEDPTVMLNLRGPMPLFFAVYYASLIESDGQITSALGRNRLHNFDSKLILVDATHATVAMSNGRVMQFTKPATKWVLAGPLDVAFQLVENGGGLVLADPRSQRMWTFDSNGVLQTIADGRGNVHTLTYTAGKLTSVSDGLGRTLTFSYDGSNHLSSVTDGTRSIAFTYSGSDLATASDALNHTTTYSYDGSGHLLSWQRPRGNSPYSQTYASERVATQSEHPEAMTTNTTALAYDTNTHETTITDPTNETRIHTHTATGELTRFKDETAKSVEITYDANQRRSSVTDRLGRKTLIAYHLPSGKRASIVEPDGATTTLIYKQRVLNGVAFYDLVKATYPDGTSRSFTYDAKGNVLTAVDQLGKKSVFTYDAHGRVLTAANATGGVMTYTYDAAENFVTSKDGGTGTTSYTYDAFSRLTKLTHPDTTHFDITYDAADRVTSITDERGNAFTYAYDVNDNVSVVTDPAGRTTQLAYDALDRVTQVTDRLGKLSSRTFDSRDWVAGATDENSNTATMAHDTRQRMSGITDPGNQTWTFGYNDEAELTSMTDPLGHTTTLMRNKRSRVVAVSDALGHTVGIERDSRQRITKMIDPVGRAMAWTYDKRSLLATASRDGLGTSKYTHDAAGRLTKITDLIGGAWSYAYTPEGRLAATSDPLGRKTTHSYDTRGRLSGVTFADGVTETVTRDGASNVTRRLYSDGTDLTYTYDSLNRRMSAGGINFAYDFEGRMTLTDYDDGNTFAATYDDGGRMKTVSYDGGGFTVTYGYDSRDRLTSVSDSLNMNVVLFTYDDAGRLTTITRGNVTTTHTYDNANRLMRIQHIGPGGTISDLRYTLNADGDITALDTTAPLLPAVQASVQPFKFDKASQLIGTGFAYDARGRIVKSPGHTFEWDGASRLKKHNSVTLTYDALGGIATRTDGATTTSFFQNYAWDLPSIAEERTGASVRRYVRTPGGMLLYSVDEANVYSFYLFDHLGSTLALTNAAGVVTDSYAYSPQGEDLGHNGPSTQPFRFVGAWDIRAEGPLYQMRARYYDPLTARFLSRDPAPPRLGDVRTLDPYLYALGNPLRYIDRDGAESETYEGTFYRVKKATATWARSSAADFDGNEPIDHLEQFAVLLTVSRDELYNMEEDEDRIEGSLDYRGLRYRDLKLGVGFELYYGLQKGKCLVEGRFADERITGAERDAQIREEGRKADAAREAASKPTAGQIADSKLFLKWEFEIIEYRKMEARWENESKMNRKEWQAEVELGWREYDFWDAFFDGLAGDYGRAAYLKQLEKYADIR
jgi:RHS repeat-associated protein